MLRTFGYGYLAVVLGIYLDELGIGAFGIGVIFTAAIAGSALMTVFWSMVADRYGRRRTAVTMSGLMFLGGLLFAFTDQFWLLMVGSFTGTISATSAEVGVFNTIEQAILPQTASDDRRTWVFSIYNMLGNFAGAAGALFAGAVVFFEDFGLEGADAFRPLFVLYALLGLANVVLFCSLSDDVELAKLHARRKFLGIHKSRPIVVKLSLIFSLDAFAGGFVVHSVVAYWFSLKWGLSTEALGILFFWVGFLSDSPCWRQVGWPGRSDCSTRWSSPTFPPTYC